MAMQSLEVYHIKEKATLNRYIYDKMVLLKLKGMAKNYKEQYEIKDIHELTFEERPVILIFA